MKSKIFGFGLSLSLFGVAACGGDAAKPAQPPPAPPLAMASAAPSSGPDMSNDSAVSTSPDIARGIKSLQAGENAVAKASFQAALTKDPHDAPDAHFYLGEVAEKQNDKITAEKEYKEALKVRPDFLEPIQNLSAMYLEAQRWDDALALIKPALAKHADDPSLNLNSAICAQGKGDAAGADAAFKKAASLAPSDPMFLLSYAHFLGQQKRGDEAVEKLRAARPLAKDDVGMLAAIGHEMHVVGAFADCVPTFDKAIAIKDAAELRTERASCKLGAKDEAGAAADLQAAIKSDASYGPAHYYLAGLYAHQKKTKESIAEYEAFLKVDGTSPIAAKAREHLKKLKSGAK